MTKLGDAKVLIETLPKEDQRTIMRFLIHAGNAEFASDLHSRISNARYSTVNLLLNTVKDQKGLSRAARTFLVERLVKLLLGDAAELERVTDLIQVSAGSLIMRRDYPQLIATPEQESAILQLTLNLMPSFNSKKPLLIDFMDGDSVLECLRLKDRAILELVSARPHEWGGIADLMLNFDVTRPAEIEAMLDGTVISPLLSGML